MAAEELPLSGSYEKMYSVLRLPARRTGPFVRIPQLESAPVSVKRVELNRSPGHAAYGH
jgi:hypothetical protein